jgi:ABC-type maltose transport system permease subunit
LQGRGYPVKIKLSEWLSLLSGSFIIFCTFIWDYSKIIIQGGFLSRFWTLTRNEQFQQIISRYEPTHYHWYLFALGEIFVLFPLVLIFMRMKFK